VDLVLNLVESDFATAARAGSVAAITAVGLVSGAAGQLSGAYTLADQREHFFSIHEYPVWQVSY